MTDVNVFICPQLDTKGLRSIEYCTYKELVNSVALWDHVFIQVAIRVILGCGDLVYQALV